MNLHKKETLKFLLNFIFSIYNCLLGMVYNSIWFLNVGVYYLILGIMRSFVVRFFFKKRKNERFVMKLSGIMILILAIILYAVVYMTVREDVAQKYHEIVMITIALYAFTKMTFAVVGIIKAKKNLSLTQKTIRSITFSDSIVSIYSLQRSMLVSFEGMTAPEIALMNALSGIGMCAVVICIGLNLIISGKKK